MRFYLLLMIVICSVFAVDNTKVEDELSFEITDANNSEKLKKLRYQRQYLDIYENKKKLRELRKETVLTDKELNDLNNIQIAQRPYNKIFKNIDYLNMHIKFPMTLVFPSDVEILHVSAFPETIDTKAWNNLIDLTPKGNLLVSNLRIKYVQDKIPGAMTIIVNRYNQEAQQDKTDYVIYPIVKYNIFTPEPIKSVLTKFKLLNSNRNPKDNDNIEINNVVYRFTEDPHNGYIILGSTKFTLDYNYK